MSQAAAEAGERLVVGDATRAGASGLRFAQALVPVLIGLAGPILVVGLIEPAALRHPKLMALAVLVPLMLVSVGLYIYTVLVPGEITAVIVDRAERALVLVQSTALATRHTPVPFEDIARLRHVTAYDDDGYASEIGEIVLRAGGAIAVPLLASAQAVRGLALAMGRPAEPGAISR